ncbi:MULTISPECIES: flagellin [Bosea]|jgi:flagellin|uniref:flagellin N-terminal helical domain-containing protein n=1 Tax=Bosea TaxID=85413 RepID=UPI00214FC918|nr:MULTISPECIES: flagellin [Bosea]MCR4521164.1 flagellin [Bosea sp. 47.2.35]MDR6830878.1 flagellin-like hook-associated protein FlgL [Bosea robiniae]MDR6897662.1 flagellin-like hook-associated protein FlgL [Bosea sp. BE109]MDR7141059.1 flagellin-like hook-associated protein FlgL [Bosea sp. BE168]MDR7177631.1 flagellin-like hook-associated protein FlgL [Bosea sp. BE271]
MAVSLSSGVRNNLASLQSTTSQALAIQNRLATGKRVNTAVDNPVNYFTAASLNERSSQLTGLLDGMSNGIQTIQTASKGIDGITKLVNSLQSTIKQAQADAAQNRPTVVGTGTTLATAAEAALTSKSLKDIALDKRLGSAGDTTVATATASTAGDLGIDLTATPELNIQIVTNPAAPTSTTDISITMTANTTVRDVVNAINGSGVATAFVDEKGVLNVKGTGSEQLGVGIGAGANAGAAVTDSATGLQNTKFGLAAADRTTGAASSGITSSVRSNLIDQYNDLRSKIDDLAKDSGYNGINLLGGDRLSIVFNEKTGKNQTKLDVQGTTLTSDNLGIAKAGNTQLAGTTNFQNDADLETATKSLTGALTSLKSLASTFGANLSVAQTRQDFTKDMASALTTGADNLTNADVNAEAASLLALQTRQQLAQTALSLANQSDQGVLRLF